MTSGLMAIDDIIVGDNNTEWTIVKEGDPGFIYQYLLTKTAIAVKRANDPWFLPIHVNPAANFRNVRSVSAFKIAPLGYSYGIWHGEYCLHSEYMKMLWKNVKGSIKDCIAHFRKFTMKDLDRWNASASN